MRQKLTLFTLVSLLLAGCGATPKGYVINGTTWDSTLNNTTIYLTNYNEDKKIDSTVVKDLKFEFKGESGSAILRIDGGNNYANVMVEDGTVASVVLSRQSVVEDNGGINSQKNVVDSLYNAYIGEFMAEQQRMFKNGVVGDELGDSLQPLIEKINLKMKALHLSTASKNLDNPLGLYMVWEIALAGEAKSVEEIDSIINIVPQAAKFTPVVNIRQSMVNREKSSVGKMFIDFDGKGVDQKVSKLSYYVGKGKYVLVDFWASWCGPCRGEIPNLRELHEMYGGDNFMVLGVNVWDKWDAFTNSLEEEGMEWSQIYASDDREATDSYGINGIPQIMLFSPDGVILERDLRGDVMKAKVKEVVERL